VNRKLYILNTVQFPKINQVFRISKSHVRTVSLLLLGIALVAAVAAYFNSHFLPHTKIVSTTKMVKATGGSVGFNCSMPKGTMKVVSPNIDGTETIRYRVTYINNVETARQKISDEITDEPKGERDIVGTGRAVSPETDPTCIDNAAKRGDLKSDLNDLMNAIVTQN
jgi:hypothetical protein